MPAPEGVAGDWAGVCGFRLLPSDDLEDGPSTALVALEAAGHAWSLRYTWSHPQDGPQSGVLLLGSPGDDSTVTAGWVDSWHQQPDLRLLSGARRDGAVDLTMDYDGWGWLVEVRREGDELGMRMHNVVPEGVEGAEPGPYVVMDACWHRTDGPDEARPDPTQTPAPPRRTPQHEEQDES